MFSCVCVRDVHLPFGRWLRYLVIRTLEQQVPSHEDQSSDAKTVSGRALWGVDSSEPQFSLIHLLEHRLLLSGTELLLSGPDMLYSHLILFNSAFTVATLWFKFCNSHYIVLVWTLHSISYCKIWFQILFVRRERIQFSHSPIILQSQENFVICEIYRGLCRLARLVCCILLHPVRYVIFLR